MNTKEPVRWKSNLFPAGTISVTLSLTTHDVNGWVSSGGTADLTEIKYGRICVAAILPALLYFLSIYCQLDLRAARGGFVGLPRDELPTIKEALSECWLLFVPLAALVVLMMVLLKEPTEAIYTALGLLILLRLPSRKRLTPSS